MGEGQYAYSLQTLTFKIKSMRPVMLSNGFLPGMGNIGIVKMVDNKHQPLLTTKAKSREFSGGLPPSGHLFYNKGTKKMVKQDNKLQVTNAKNIDFLDFTSGTLPPVNIHFISPEPLSASKTLAEELAASTSFAEAAYLYPSATATLDAAFTHSRNFQSFANSKVHHHQPNIEYISLSNNIPSTNYPPKDIGDVENFLSVGKVAVVFVEPIGNGGIKSFTPQYLQSLRTACDKNDVLLAFDEVQCGLSQMGQLWAHQELGVEPDFIIVQFRGLKIGALVVNKKMNASMRKYENEHIPIECGDALKIFRLVGTRAYLALVTRKSRYFEEILKKKLLGNGHVRGVRVFGLVAAVELDVDAQSFVDDCDKCGLGIVVAGNGNIIRIMPPLTVNAFEMDDAVDIIHECLRNLEGNDWVRPVDFYRNL